MFSFPLETLMKYKSDYEAYSEHCKTPKMEIFSKIFNGFQPLRIFTKNFILDEYSSENI